MHDYSVPVDDIRFVWEHLAELPRVATMPGFGECTAEEMARLVEGGARFYEDVWAPTDRPADLAGSHLVDGRIEVLDALRDAYHRTMDGGWNVLPRWDADSEDGIPWTVHAAFIEMASAGNGAFSQLTGLIAGALELLETSASPELQAQYIPKLTSGEWAGAMDLTEPDAGSNLGALTARAIPQPDGTYRLFGTKRFISWGDHELTDNIVHLVLARIPGAPAGTAGISCFVVSKHLVEPDGSLGRRNDIRCTHAEQNLGFRASPTCVMSLGDEDGAVGHLVGAEHSGMRIMFTMMNSNRLATALGALGISDRARQKALAYARQRVQGVPMGHPDGTPIIEHPDVRRMLMAMRAIVEGQRALCYLTAATLDRAAHLADDAERAEQRRLANLLTPIAKAWCSDQGIEVTSTAIQVLGGAGWVEESGVAQHYRDVRVLSIFEGTNGIQSLDLVGRKIGQADGATVAALLDEMRASADEHVGSEDGDLAAIGAGVAAAVEVLAEATAWMRSQGDGLPLAAAAGATAYQRLFGGVLVAHLLARGAAAAAAATPGPVWSAEFLDAKVATARFYVEQVLPTALAAAGPAMAGETTVFAIPADHL